VKICIDFSVILKNRSFAIIRHFVLSFNIDDTIKLWWDFGFYFCLTVCHLGKMSGPIGTLKQDPNRNLLVETNIALCFVRLDVVATFIFSCS